MSETTEPPIASGVEEQHAALLELRDGLVRQYTEISRAFGSMLKQVQRTVVAFGPHQQSTPPELCQSLGQTVKELETLFRFLFERVYLHQLEGNLVFADIISRSLAGLADHCTTDTVKVGLDNLMRAPFVSHRFQGLHFPVGMPSKSTPVTEGHANRQRSERHSSLVPVASTGTLRTAGESAHGTLCISSEVGPPSYPFALPSAEVRRIVKASAWTFAISSKYSKTERNAAIDIITDGVHATAVVLPTVADEDNLAARLRCRLVVTPERPRHFLIPHVTVDLLRRFLAHGKGNTRLRYSFPSVSSRDSGSDTEQSEVVGLLGEAGYAEDHELVAILTMLDSAMESTATDSSPPGSTAPVLAPLAPIGPASPFGSPISKVDVLDSRSQSPYCTSQVISRDTLRSFAGRRKRSRAVRERASMPLGGDDTAGPAVPVALRGDTLEAAQGLNAQVSVKDDEEIIHTQYAAPLESQLVQYRHIEDGAASVSSMLASAQERIPPSEWMFQISNSVKDSKQSVIEAIRKLGAQVDLSNHYNPQTTHLVVVEGLSERTEKYLSCCAAGRLIVSSRFIFDSARRGYWLMGSMNEYNISPLRRHVAVQMEAPFGAWRVLLFACHASVANGISTVLRAGGCTRVQVQVLDPATSAVVTTSKDVTHAVGDDNDKVEEMVAQATHILVECSTISPVPGMGHFLLPSWFPRWLMRQELYQRIFTLEVLHYCLCTSPDRVFDDEGRLIEESRLSRSCRVEPFAL